VCDSAGSTPLHYCQSAQAAKLLIEAGASVNTKNHEGKTPFHCASDEAIAQVLIAAGADTETADNSGEKSPDYKRQS
jgi:ankyrin repeat protein